MRFEPVRRDWRWAVAVVGKVLIATGLLMFGFVGYQLWGTGMEYARAQDRLDDEFAELLGTVPTVATTTTSPTTTTTSPTPTSVAPTVPPTTSTVPETTVAPAPPEFAPGAVMARIEIPAIGLDAKVVSGVQPTDLKQGPGHYPDTPMPGQFGNAAIAGHRTTYGQPFFRLDEVAPGDEIVLTTVQGRFVYRATGSEVVDANRSDVVATTDPAIAQLTLTTCHPRYSATRRLIVRADLDGEASAAPQPPVVAPGGQDVPSTLPGGPATTESSPAITGSSAATTTTEAPPPTTPSSVPDTTAPGPVGGSDGTSGEVTEEAADAFSHGWFSDDAAFPQVALWGLLLTAISVGAWLLSRAVGRNWVGALVGIVPFGVVLYFFFQNVNRLLPAAL